MEEWQIEHITQNLKQLTELTTFNSLLKAELVAKKILSQADVEKLDAVQRESGKLEASIHGYQMLLTRIGAYKVLYEALKELNQSGAYTILINNDVFDKVFLDMAINVQERTFKIKEFFPAADHKSLQGIFRKCLTELEYYNIFVTEGKPFVLANNTLPPKPTYYVPRFLSNRVKIDESVFKSNCEHVFVFKNTIERPQLSRIAQPNSTFKSTSQLDNITCRFIYLENDKHWNKLKKSAKVPIHLINYEAYQDVYLLEDTSSASEILRKLGSGEERVYMSEEEFVQQQLLGNSTSSVCICDTPGMGKTYLLENIARSMADKCVGRIVVFIQLSSFANAFCQDSTNSDLEPEASLINVLSDTLSPWSNKSLLLTLVKAEILRVDVFFDGFDEIPNDKVEGMKQVFRSITTSYPKVRIYITSRPHMRQELEQSLGVVAYDILPFKKKSQVDFLVQFWQSKKLDLDQASLQEYATSCLKFVNESLTKNDKQIAGIPLLCLLISEVYSDKDDFRSIKTEGFNDVPLQISEMYQIFVMKKIKLLATDEKEFDNIKKVYIWHALKLLFPTNGFHEDTKFKTFNESPTSSKMLTGGILQKHSNGTLEFIHRTFAEFLVAEYFSTKLIEIQKSEEVNCDSMSVFKLLLCCKKSKDIYGNEYDLRFSDPSKIRENYEFVHLVIMSFLNSSFVEDKISEELKMRGATFISSISHEDFIGILCACCHHNLLNLFCLLTQPLTKWDNFRILGCFTNDNSYDILRICIRESTSQLFQKCSNLLAEDLKLNLEQINTVDKNSTLLQMAVECANYEAVEYFGNRISLKNLCLLKKCVKYSYAKDDVEKRRDILKFLHDTDPTLIHEFANLLITNGIAVRLFKILVEFGANLTAAEEYYGNCAMLAAAYMSSSDYHDLIQFLLTDCKAKYLFLDNEKWKDPLPTIIRKASLLPETLELLLNIPGIDINMKDENGDNLLFSAVGGNKLENFQHLVKRGLDYSARGKENRSLLHVAAMMNEGGVDMVRYMLSLKLNPNSRDQNEWTPLHCAVNRFPDLDKVKVLVENGANIQAKNNKGQTALHISGMSDFIDPVVMKYIIGIGVGVNDRDNDGNTPAHLCTPNSKMKCLVGMGADIHAENKNGQTPVQLYPDFWK